MSTIGAAHQNHSLFFFYNFKTRLSDTVCHIYDRIIPPATVCRFIFEKATKVTGVLIQGYLAFKTLHPISHYALKNQLKYIEGVDEEEGMPQRMLEVGAAVSLLGLILLLRCGVQENYKGWKEAEARAITLSSKIPSDRFTRYFPRGSVSRFVTIRVGQTVAVGTLIGLAGVCIFQPVGHFIMKSYKRHYEEDHGRGSEVFWGFLMCSASVISTIQACSPCITYCIREIPDEYQEWRATAEQVESQRKDLEAAVVNRGE